MKKNIYVVDDEKNIRQLIKTFLESENYEVEVFSNGSELREAFKNKKPDMIILDIMMPGEDGLSLCSYLRKESNVPIIIVSAKDSPLDRVNGITLGSDDYLTKPFLPLELIARVKAIFRRIDSVNNKDKNNKEEFKCGNLILSCKKRSVCIYNAQLSVTPTEFDFLLYLIEREGIAVSKEELIKNVWRFKQIDNNQRITDDLVKRLRKKLRENGANVMIETVWGFGYRIVANVR